MWESTLGNKICCVCKNHFNSHFCEKDNCYVCGRKVCHECRQFRLNIPPPEGCPRYEANYEICSEKVPVCLSCIKNPNIFFIKERPKYLPECVEKVFNLCVEAAILSQKVFPVSSSSQYFQKNYDPNLFETEEEKYEHFSFGQGMLDQIREDSYLDKHTLEEVETGLSQAIKLSVGNCMEKSLLCFMYIFYAYRRREIFTMEFGLFSLFLKGHVFLMVSPTGVKLPIEMFNATELNKNPIYKNVIICDPYKKAVFFAPEYTKYMSPNVKFFADKLDPTHFSFKNLGRSSCKYRNIEQLWENMRSIYIDESEENNEG
ncbi:hypothetical protein AAEX28_10655 [Lentisphaerota bacterium WC36G]|nr:hypothetical protein LJT99_13500 [Lentisphaerae bacterium WC36]